MSRRPVLFVVAGRPRLIASVRLCTAEEAGNVLPAAHLNTTADGSVAAKFQAMASIISFVDFVM